MFANKHFKKEKAALLFFWLIHCSLEVASERDVLNIKYYTKGCKYFIFSQIEKFFG